MRVICSFSLDSIRHILEANVLGLIELIHSCVLVPNLYLWKKVIECQIGCPVGTNCGVEEAALVIPCKWDDVGECDLFSV